VQLAILSMEVHTKLLVELVLRFLSVATQKRDRTMAAS
jgi:hypothetical protein